MSKLLFSKTLEELFDKIKWNELFKKGEKICVKLHMGEKGNKFFLRPEYIKKVIAKLKSIGVEPFLFDSPTTYKGARHTVEQYLQTASEHGFTEEAVGCPIVISNEGLTVKGKYYDIDICKPQVDADGVLVFSHVKGHRCSGFGCAVKNLGMGSLTKETKGRIHAGGEPVYVGECNQCGECVRHCNTKNIKLGYDGPEFGQTFCAGCSNCAIFCPTKAIKPKVDYFDWLLAEGAVSAYKLFKKSYYINAVVQISDRCDCDDAKKIVAQDIGYLAGEYPVAIDTASIELINKQEGKNVFLEENKKDPLTHVKDAEKLGMGSAEYEVEM
jgi:hypothetical protein